MFVFVHTLDATLARMNLPASATMADDFLVGFLVAGLVLSLEVAHQREMQRQQQQLAIIREMNHHVRNALQAIVYLSHELDSSAVEQIREATQRIEWALREVLPRNLDDKLTNKSED